MQYPKTIVNLSTITLTAQMRSFGVFDLSAAQKQQIITLMTLSKEPPSQIQYDQRIQAIIALALTTGARKAMIEAPSVMIGALERALMSKGIEPLHPYGYTEKKHQEIEKGVYETLHLYRLISLTKPA